MKKQLSVLLCACLLLCLGAVAASAAETAPPEAIYILAAPPPKRAIKFMGQMIENPGPEIMDQATDPTSVASFGHPFAVNRWGRYFPVLLEGRIVWTYYQYRSEWWQWDYSYMTSPGMLVEELNNLAGETTADAPALIYQDENNDLVFQTQYSTQTIWQGRPRDRVVPVPRIYADELAAQRAADPKKASVNMLEPIEIPPWTFFERVINAVYHFLFIGLWR